MKLTSDNLNIGKGNLGGELRTLYDRLHGRNKDQLFNAEGARVQLEGALIRTGNGHYHLAIRFGDHVVSAMTFPSHDPDIQALALERFGPSPADLERKRQRKEHERKTHDELIDETVELYQSWGLDAHRGYREPVSPRNYRRA